MYPSPVPWPRPVSEDYGKVFINCVPCSGVVIGQVAAPGKVPATYAEAQALRIATKVDQIPLGPPNLATAFLNRYGWHLPVFKGTVSQLIADLRAGMWGAIYINYGRLPKANRLSDFTGDHCVAVGAYNHDGQRKAGYLIEIDPLFRPTSTSYRGQWISEVDLAKALLVTNGVPLANLVYPGQFSPKPVVVGATSMSTVLLTPNGVGGHVTVKKDAAHSWIDLETGKAIGPINPDSFGSPWAVPGKIVPPVAGGALGLDRTDGYAVTVDGKASFLLATDVDFAAIPNPTPVARVGVTAVDVHFDDGSVTTTKP